MEYNEQNTQDIIGKISPPPGMSIGAGDPVQALANFIGFAINAFIFVASGALLIYLLWGAFDWINSGGEKEKIAKAQQKITNAVIGIILVFFSLTIFGLVTGNILGIIDNKGGWVIKIPTLR